MHNFIYRNSCIILFKCRLSFIIEIEFNKVHKCSWIQPGVGVGVGSDFMVISKPNLMEFYVYVYGLCAMSVSLVFGPFLLHVSPCGALIYY